VATALAEHGELSKATLGFDPAPYMQTAAALATRTVTGGAAVAPMEAMLAHANTTIAAATASLRSRRDQLVAAEASLRQLAVC